MACCQRRCNSASSSSRPTSGVRSRPCNASKRLSAALPRSTRAGHHRRAQALELDGTQIRVLEQTAGQPPRARRDHHGPRLGQCLQPRREVRRLADHRLFLRCALADQIADDHQPGGDADPHLQWRRRDGVEPGHLLDQLQPGAHRALGIVLVGPRIAEIGEHAVAHVLGDKPAAAPDHLGNAAVIGADHRAQILRVEPRRQRRRADQIAEHHRQLPPLGLAGPDASILPRLHKLGRRDRRAGAREVRSQRGDRGQQLAPMADKIDAQILQIVGRQLAQDLGIDRVIVECRGVLFEPQPSQPIGDLDRHCRGLRSPAEASPPGAIPRGHSRYQRGRRQSGGHNADSDHPAAA